MENPVEDHKTQPSSSGYKSFAFKRFAVAVVLIVLAVWGLSVGPDMVPSSRPTPPHVATSEQAPAADQETGAASTAPHDETSGTVAGALHAAATPDPTATNEPAAADERPGGHGPPAGTQAGTPAGPKDQAAHQTQDTAPAAATPHPPAAEGTETGEVPHQAAPGPDAPGAHDTAATHADEAHSGKTAAGQPQDPKTAGAKDHAPAAEPDHDVHLPPGVAFVGAVMQPLNHELNERFWGWRANDIVNITDNINNFQIGALEVTRRSVVMLAERISRTGTTAAFNKNLEYAMNWLMVKADRYWFPSPESKYRESLRELEKYKQDLIGGKASFHTRSDNIIPLLASYEDLLGSCDENLVKQKDKDGTGVSFFEADDYFFYAKGVASTMAVILEAVHHDFGKTIKARHGEELLHHAIESCRQAAALDPLVITDSDLDGIFANHRAHMAAPISHARFYIGQLIKTLST